MQYRDLEIHIVDATRSAYDVILRTGEAGEEIAREHFTFFDEVRRIAGRMDRLKTLSDRGDARLRGELKLFGFQLFEQIFGETADSGNAVLSLMRDVMRAGRMLRLRLRIEPTELEAIPWEFLSNGKDFVAVEDRTPISRLPVGLRRREASPIRLPIQLVLAVSAPSDLSAEFRLDRARERRLFLQAVEDLVGEGLLEVRFVAEGDPERVAEALRAGATHVLVLLGQTTVSTGGGSVLMERGGISHPMAVGRLVETLAGPRAPRLLIAGVGATAPRGDGVAYRGLARALLAKGLAAALVIPYPMEAESLRLFLVETFRGVQASQPLDVAVARGRRALLSKDLESVDFGLPQLFLNDPDCLRVL